MEGFANVLLFSDSTANTPNPPRIPRLPVGNRRCAATTLTSSVSSDDLPIAVSRTGASSCCRLIPLIAVQPRFSTVRCKVLSSSPLPCYPSVSSMLVRPVVLQDPPKHPFPAQLPLSNPSRFLSPLDATLTQVLILRHLKSFGINTYTKTVGRAPLPTPKFGNSLLPPTTLKPTISATVTSPANPSLSIACGHFPSPIGVGGRTAASSSSSTSTLNGFLPLALHRLQKTHLRKSFVCHSCRHPPPLSPFPATLTKTPEVAYPLQTRAASISSFDFQPLTLNLMLPSSDLTRRSPPATRHYPCMEQISLPRVFTSINAP